MGPFIPPLPVLSCEAAFNKLAKEYNLHDNLQLTTICSTVQLNSVHICYPTVQLEKIIHSHFKKQPIVQLEPYPCVNSTVDHSTYKIQFPCATSPSHRHLVVKGPVVSLRDGLHRSSSTFDI